MVCSGDTLCPRGVVPWLRFAQADTAESDHVGLVLDQLEPDLGWALEAVHAGGPVPAALLEGLHAGQARPPKPALGGTIGPPARLAFQEFAQVIHRGPRLVGGLLGQRGLLLGDTGELQIRARVLDGALRLWRPLQGVGCRHGGGPPLGRVLAAVGWREQG